jgi:hypothetical protein
MKSQSPRLLRYKLCIGKYLVWVYGVTNLNSYRESEAQTDPFTPEYQIEKENAPEVLTIAHLKYGKGLPASMAEMELIE